MLYKLRLWSIADFSQKILTHTRDANRWELHEKVSRGVLRNTIGRFFDHLPDRERYPDITGVPEQAGCRKIDEALFWELINLSGEGADSVEGHLSRLYLWNVWALAFAARDGCVEDSFHEFRSWLILRGSLDRIEKSIDRPNLLARTRNWSRTTQCEEKTKFWRVRVV